MRIGKQSRDNFRPTREVQMAIERDRVSGHQSILSDQLALYIRQGAGIMQLALRFEYRIMEFMPTE